MNPNEQTWKRKKRLEQALSLTPEETGLTKEALELGERQEPKQQDLDFYAEVFSEAAQRHYPIREADRQELQYFQRVLHLEDAAVEAIEQRSLHQLGIQPTNGQVESAQASGFTPSPTGTDPNSTNLQTSTMQPADLLSASGSNTSTANQTAVQRAVTQRVERSPLNSGYTTQPPEPQAAVEFNPAFATNASLPSQRVILEESAIPVSEPIVQASSTVPNGRSTATAATPATPVAASSAATPPREPVVRAASRNKQFLFPLFGFLIGLTALGVIWFMVRPILQPNQVDPQKAQQFMKWGIQKTQQGEYQKAISDFNDAIRLNPTEIDGFINRGYAKHRVRDLNGAASDYNQAIQLNPKSAEAHSNLSHVQFDQRRYDEAGKSAQQAIQLKRDLPEAHLNLGNAKQATNDLDGAAAEFQTTIGLKANNITHARAYNNLGNVFTTRGQFDQAIRNYNEAIQRDANYADAFLNRGLAYNRQGNGQSAIQDLNRAAELYQAQQNTELRDRAKRTAEDIQRGLTTTPLPPANSPNSQQSI